MKQKLAINTGIAAATSIAFAAIAPVTQALDLVPETQGILANNGANTIVYDLENRAASNPDFNEPGVLEIGEYAPGVELRSYAEFDISSFIPGDFTEALDIANTEFSIGFDILAQGGSGTAGSGSQNNLGNPYTGVVNVLWYAGTAFNPVAFNPLIGPASLPSSLGLPDAVNPLYSFSVGGSSPNNFDVGDRVEIDASALVRNLLLNAFDQGSNPVERFGIMLLAQDLTDNNPGVCGGIGQRPCEGLLFNNVGADAREVPTPAAILPSIIGFATLAVRKKKDGEEAA